MSRLAVRFRLDLDTRSSVGPGKIALLEQIGRVGSLSQAARELGMSYRRAWLLLQSVNQAFRGPVVTLRTGGPGGGGARVTALGTTVIHAYRSLEQRFQRQAEQAFGDMARSSRQVAPPQGRRRRALSRRKGG